MVGTHLHLHLRALNEFWFIVVVAAVALTADIICIYYYTFCLPQRGWHSNKEQ